MWQFNCDTVKSNLNFNCEITWFCIRWLQWLEHLKYFNRCEIIPRHLFGEYDMKLSRLTILNILLWNFFSWKITLEQFLFFLFKGQVVCNMQHLLTYYRPFHSWNRYAQCRSVITLLNYNKYKCCACTL